MIPEFLNREIYFNLSRVNMLMKRAIARLLSTRNISAEQWEILLLFENNPCLHQSDLVNLTLRDKGNLSRIISKMVAEGWLNRDEETKDRRTSRLHLTKKGQDLREKITGDIWNQLAGVMSPLGGEDHDELVHNLRKLRIVLGDEQAV